MNKLLNAMLVLNIPQKVSITIADDWIIVKGPLGTKKKKKAQGIFLQVDNNARKIWLLNKTLKEKHFYFSMLNKIILGVLYGYCIKINIVGVGYKAVIEDSYLKLKVGFSHNVNYKIPSEISLKVLTQRLLTIVISGNDYQQVTQVAAEIRALKPAEPYKGKGIRYANEIIKKKEGKKTNV